MKALTNLNELVATNAQMYSPSGFQQTAPQIISQGVPVGYSYQHGMPIIQPLYEPLAPPSYQVIAAPPPPPAYQMTPM